jgi:hypothetical protein
MARPVDLTDAGRLVIPLTMKVGSGWTVSLTPAGRTANSGSKQMAVRSDETLEFLRVSPGEFTRNEGDRVLAWGALVQSGAFHFYLPEGDYRFSISNLLPNLDVGSVTSGDVNVLVGGLRVRADGNSPNLRVILREK